MKKIEYYDDITKELLDSIKVGDEIKINDWKTPLVVKGVSENYFVMAIPKGDVWDYSVCEKKPREAGNHNRMQEGMFHVSTDHWIFGYKCDRYRMDDPKWVRGYLKSFEDEDAELHSELSERSGIPINVLAIRRAHD